MTHTVLIAEDEALVAAFLEDIIVQVGFVPWAVSQQGECDGGHEYHATRQLP